MGNVRIPELVFGTLELVNVIQTSFCFSQQLKLRTAWHWYPVTWNTFTSSYLFYLKQKTKGGFIDRNLNKHSLIEKKCANQQINCNVKENNFRIWSLFCFTQFWSFIQCCPGNFFMQLGTNYAILTP